MNPFKYGQVVMGEDFCPRPELLRGIKEYIRSGQNILIQGERRTGKTSLICEAVRRIKKKKLLYVDLLGIKSVDDFCGRLVRGIISMEEQEGFVEKVFKSISQLKPIMTVDPVTGQTSISIGVSEKLKPDSIEALLDIIQKARGKKALVVVFDEFQDILTLKESREALAVLRSKIQFHGDIPYIFAGSIRNRMNEIFNHPGSAFFKSAVTINVGQIERKRFSKFLSDKFSLDKRRIKRDTLDKIFEIADNIPNDVQQLCGTIWEKTSHGEEITDKIIPEALKLIFARESKGYEATLVQVTGLQLKVLTGLAKAGGKAPLSGDFLRSIGSALPSSVKKALSRLEKLQILFYHDGEYKFVNPFFRAWLIYMSY